MLKKPATPATSQPSPFLPLIGCLVFVLALLFWRGWQPGYVVFSNDGPLGQQMAEYHRPAEGFTGAWQDLNWLGVNSGAVSPGITAAPGGLQIGRAHVRTPV